MKFIKKHKILILIWIFLIGIGVYFFLKSRETKEETQYATAQVEKGTLLVTVSASGTLVAEETEEIVAKISGEIGEILVAEGDKVEKDQVIFKIQNDNLDLELSKAYISYLQANQSLEKIKLDKLSAEESLADLKEKDSENDEVVTDLEIKIAEQKVNSTAIEITAAENQVWEKSLVYQEAKETAQKREIKASISGTVTSITVKVGEEIAGGNAILATIVNFDNLLAEVEINEMDIANINKDQKATLTLDGLSTTTTYTGKVVMVDSTGINNQGVVSYQAKISFDSIDLNLKTGMTVSADIIVNRKEEVLLVTNSAIKTKGTESCVQVLRDGNVIEDVVLELGLASSSQTEVVSGLKEGETVVTGTVSSNSSDEENNTNQGNGSGFNIPGMGGGEMRMR